MGDAGRVQLLHGDCRALFPQMADGSIDAVISDPPYPEIDRAYGRLTEGEWMALMQEVVVECRRVLTPTGSAVFILQPNSEHVGSMRLWLWRFLVWAGETWNVVQDAYWWNTAAQPTVHTQRVRGLMRPSLKFCVWLGASDCYRNQDEVLLTETEANRVVRASARITHRLDYFPSGGHNRRRRQAEAVLTRGGVTPYNLLPIPNSNNLTSAGAQGHGAGTPYELCAWWVRYLCPPGGTVLDPFAGTATVGEAAIKRGCSFVGMENYAPYWPMAAARCAAAQAAYQPTLLDVPA
jgi:DNA modification methylase